MSTRGWRANAIERGRVAVVLGDADRSVVRVPLLGDVLPVHMAVAHLLAQGAGRAEIGQQLRLPPRTVDFYLDQLAAVIPGDLPRTCRIVTWYRGATLAVLGGSDL